jgi:Ni,Fe-hydrogenase III component G
VEGGLYAYDERESTYVKITDNLGLETVDYGHIEYLEDNILEFRENELVLLRSNVKIWGVADAEYCSNIKTFTYEELGKMFELVKASNKKNNRNDSIEIILLYTIDKNGRRDLCSVIVEVYVADENGNAVSVNDIIFRKYCGD